MNAKLFPELGLSPELLKAIDRLGFEQASPIQSEAIPVLMQGKDIVGQSQTGSGKTAAFGIPAVEKVDPQVRAVQVLILCPTRELAVQVAEEAGKLSFFKRGLSAVPIYGGQSYDRQFRALESGVQARHYLINRCLTFLVSNFVAYMLNVMFVFKPGRHSKLKEFGLFYLVSGIAFEIGRAHV